MPHGRGGRPRTDPPPGWQRWAFPAAAATLIPLAILAGLEMTLRVVDVGYPTSFFVPLEGQSAETTNHRFGHRFFPPAIARRPVAQRLPAAKPKGSYRIYVLGGSAAMGTPEPAFGLARVLEVILEERYPSTDFEVLNAAMAAINSHVALEIARDCARRDPDLFAVYLGNNEVVGPFGPGTVFTAEGSPPGVIRLGLGLRRLRSAQLLARGLSVLGRPTARQSSWRGMEMFLDHRVPVDDPRLERTYGQLGDNLTAIARLAARAGAPVLLSTVAVDLRDTPPFGSAHRQDLDPAALEAWRSAVESGDRLAAAGRVEEALARLESALEIDDRHAALHYRIGRLQIARGDSEKARHHLTLARDLDTLRVRADRRINQVIREVADNAPGAVRLVDAERRLAAAPESHAELPGSELFWEHVHLRFLGTYRLALAFLEPLEELLPETVRDAVAKPMPGPARVAEALALTPREQWRMAAAIHRMTARPPFTHQLEHESRQLASRRAVQTARAQAMEGADEATIEAYRRALARRPEDLQLKLLLAQSLDDLGLALEAIDTWRELDRQVPGVAAWQTGLGFALAAAGEHDAAADSLYEALESRPESADARVNLASVLEQSGDPQAAERLYREAIALAPASAAARANLADLLERGGRRDAAERQYAELLALDPSSATAHRRLGELHDRRGDSADAIHSYREALRLDPELASVHNNLGFLLAESGHFEEAAREYLSALDDDPRYALAYFNLGDLLLELGRAAEAVAAYRAGLAIQPDNQQARANMDQARRLATAS
jgi:tetratricopeptide (TPR) repeat protein